MAKHKMLLLNVSKQLKRNDLKKKLSPENRTEIHTFFHPAGGASICLYYFLVVIPKVLSADLVLIPLEPPAKLLLVQKESIDVGCFFKRAYYLGIAKAFVLSWQRLKENPITEQNRITTKSFLC